MLLLSLVGEEKLLKGSKRLHTQHLFVLHFNVCAVLFLCRREALFLLSLIPSWRRTLSEIVDVVTPNSGSWFFGRQNQSLQEVEKASLPQGSRLKFCNFALFSYSFSWMSAQSVSSTNTNRTADSIGPGSLPVWLTDDLLELIEANGGIQRCRGKDHHLEKLLNQDKDKFGEPGHNLRRRIQNKVYDWQRKYKAGKYKISVLDTRSTPIIPFEARNINISQQQQDLSDHESDGSSLGGTSIESETVIDPVIAIPKGKRGPKSKNHKILSPPQRVTRSQLKSPPLKSPPKEVAFEQVNSPPKPRTLPSPNPRSSMSSPAPKSSTKKSAAPGAYGYTPSTSKSIDLPDDYSK